MCIPVENCDCPAHDGVTEKPDAASRIAPRRFEADDDKRRQAEKERIAERNVPSSPKAQRTFAKAHDSSAEEYGSERRAHRVAYSVLKHYPPPRELIAGFGPYAGVNRDTDVKA